MIRLAIFSLILACTSAPPGAVAPRDSAACPAPSPIYDCTFLPCLEICEGMPCDGPRALCVQHSLPTCLCLPVGTVPDPLTGSLCP